MTETFTDAMTFVLRWEGKYFEDPADPGGETKYGITKRSYPALDIKNLTEPQAIAIYHQDYWERAGCDELPYPMDIIVFDTAVNMGVSAAKVLLQENKDLRDYLLSRIARYVKITNPKNEKFLRGWLNRVLALRKVVR